MNCRTCNYALWNIAPGPCPECGTSFAPSEFRFLPGAVQFHCPRCKQQYFGTDEAGLLVPPSFICVKCAEPVELDQMSVSPAQGVDERETVGILVPWMQNSLGFTSRWSRTLHESLLNPVRLGKGIQPDDSHRKVWYFAILNCLSFTLISYLSHAFLLGVVLSFAAPGGMPPAAAGGAVLGLGVLFGAAGLVVYPIYILVWGVCTHLCLKVGRTKPAFSLKQTYAAICYSSGASVVNIIPCLGLYHGIGMLWWVVSSIFVLRHAQRVPIHKAVVASLLPPLLIVITCFGGYVGVIAYAINSMKSSLAASSVSTGDITDHAQVNQLLTALVTDAERSRKWPNHIAELAFKSGVTSATFTLAGSGTFKDGLPLLDSTLEQAVMLPPTAEKRMQQRLTVLQVPPVYRFGDYIFCYSGLAPQTRKSQPGVWLLFSFPDSAAARNPFAPLYPGGFSPAPAASNVFHVGFADGHVGQFGVSAFQSMLDEQNALRTKLALPLIPAPASLPSPQPDSPAPAEDVAPR